MTRVILEETKVAWPSCECEKLQSREAELYRKVTNSIGIYTQVKHSYLQEIKFLLERNKSWTRIIKSQHANEEQSRTCRSWGNRIKQERNKVVRSKLRMREIIVERNRVEQEDYKSVLKFTLKWSSRTYKKHKTSRSLNKEEVIETNNTLLK